MRGTYELEPMEQRRLLSSATLTVDGVLTVVGDTKARNQIVVSTSTDALAVDVTLNGGAAQSFVRALVQSITITGGGKTDNLAMDETNGKLGIPITIYGKRGNDTLRADLSNATLIGG